MHGFLFLNCGVWSESEQNIEPNFGITIIEWAFDNYDYIVLLSHSVFYNLHCEYVSPLVGHPIHY